MNLDQAFTFGQDCYNQDLANPSKHPRISKKSPFYSIVKPTTSQKNYRIKDPSVQQLTQTIQKNTNKENYNSHQQNVVVPKHTRNPTDLNLIRFDTSPNSKIEISNNSRSNNQPQDHQRRLSFNTPNQTIRTSLPPVNNTEKYKKVAMSMKELIQKQKYCYEIGDYEQIELIFEKLDLLCDQL
ncbi:unnamed protein product (macronuclear) [Paramecium tetraurelia]|uniref:Uncharacterized protein n=1 Tax=Paramecium tetraurelia TaxID=5888 RepID=A0CQR5_PARTE|nr:uncharacterized protein GSPATT00009480001 [Paramecium tetraurelia]CAK73132.1 unnamed protein product [Paramecium tetraurelia]|eukprot:XP_001440529.1 hypothetical protein (macronuclear) [Paramecium tetraurelia strain d4-2]